MFVRHHFLPTSLAFATVLLLAVPHAARATALDTEAARGGSPPAFVGGVARLDSATRALMTGRSWRPGCPMGLDTLRQVRVTYLGFDGEAHRGRVVVQRRWARPILRVFQRLFEVGFPLRHVFLVDRYAANDRRSMAADNTSAFNCRWRAGVCCVWSQHAFGRAIDLDPVENPFVWQGGVSPPAGVRFLNRARRRPGMIHHGDAVWRAFHSIGWEWGGDWSEPDYQHFSANGR